MVNRIFVMSVAVLLTLTMTACTHDPYLPSAEESYVVPTWENFDQAMGDYNKIIPGETKANNLVEFGFDPYKSPNIRVLSYLDILKRFIPNSSVAIEQLDDDIKACLRVREKCFAYETAVRVEKTQRQGNVFLDLFRFKRKEQETGWEFYALVIINDDTVVYKIWSGQPNIIGTKNHTNPLGFIQKSASGASKLN